MQGMISGHKTIRAVFENGVFRPLDAVELPEKTEVEFEPRPPKPPYSLPCPSDAELDAVYEILGRRYQSGHADTAARHNEHQP